MIALVLAAASLAVWIYLVCARGGFWLGRERDGTAIALPADPPSVAIVVPARNEADGIAQSVTSLLSQDYPAYALIVVDDDSQDGTAELARHAALAIGAQDRLTVLAGQPLPPRWTGKLWAVKQGIAAAEEKFAPQYLMLTDADIVHAPGTVSWLVAHAEQGSYVLTSLMAKLRCESLPERSHVPAFIYFFQMLYPFAWVRRPEATTAAAAGGCMLLKSDALRAAGGIDSIRNALIDDCALAKRLKRVGTIWLGLTERVRSIRPYETLSDVRQMIARSAYAQLNFSPLLLLGTLLGLALTFLVGPLLAIFAHGLARWIGLAVWAAMALSFVPTLRFYKLSLLWGIALPAIAALYALYTLDSAWRYWRHRGGQWKGRVHVNAPSLQ